MSKLSKSKTMATVIPLFLVLTIFASLVALPTVNAHTPPRTYPTWAYLAISPSPIGVGQSVYLVMWVSPQPPTRTGFGGDVWRGLTLTITKPNNDIETLGPWNADATGSTFTTYTPNQVGTYKFEFKYPGQNLSLYSPEGIPSDLSAVSYTHLTLPTKRIV